MLAAGARIAAPGPGGRCPVEALDAGGTVYNPLTGQEIRIRHLLRRELRWPEEGAPGPRPVRLRRAALDSRRPDRDLVMLESQCLLAPRVAGGVARLDMVTAASLVGSGAEAAAAPFSATFYAVVTGTPALMLAEGICLRTYGEDDLGLA